MDSKASSSRAYRTPTVNDGSDDEDDLDDLDDVLEGFNQPKPSAPVTSTTTTQAATAPKISDEHDDDFENDLAGEMEQLLRQLAGTHIPGPMADVEGDAKNSTTGTTSGKKAEGGTGVSLSKEDEEAAFQKAIEMMLSPEGIAAMGLDASGQSSTPRKPPSVPPSLPGGAKPTFDETIQRTMESLGSKRSAGNGMGGLGDGGGDIPPDLAALLAKMGEGGLGDGDGEDDYAGLLDGMMSQLMTKELLEEPMAELASKYPAYLASSPEGVSPEQLETYRKQHGVIEKIVAVFRKSSYSAEEDSPEITRLVSELQDLGEQPKELIGDLPEGLDLSALGGDESCTIM